MRELCYTTFRGVDQDFSLLIGKLHDLRNGPLYFSNRARAAEMAQSLQCRGRHFLDCWDRNLTHHIAFVHRHSRSITTRSTVTRSVRPQDRDKQAVT